MTTKTETPAQRHAMKSDLLQKLAYEVCPRCAAWEKLLRPTRIGGDSNYYTYHHPAGVCSASGLFVWAESENIRFVSFAAPIRLTSNPAPEKAAKK